jgi:hypothetical protein
VNSKLNKRPDAILGVEQETVAHGESCACTSYHVHCTRDVEGTCTVFFTFLPAKGPFVTSHDPFMASFLTVFAVRKAFSTLPVFLKSRWSPINGNIEYIKNLSAIEIKFRKKFRQK